jgi:hypothetical protein
VSVPAKSFRAYLRAHENSERPRGSGSTHPVFGFVAHLPQAQSATICLLWCLALLHGPLERFPFPKDSRRVDKVVLCPRNPRDLVELFRVDRFGRSGFGWRERFGGEERERGRA